MFISNIKIVQSAKGLKDRKCLKSLSDSAAFAMTAMEVLEKDLNDQLTKKKEETFGLFVAAPAPYSSDKNCYHAAAMQSMHSENSLKEFATLAQSASPNAGLIGLPNGVLNFGAKLLGARGPNSCHISAESSVHLALSAIWRHMKLGRTNACVITAYAKPSELFANRDTEKNIDGGFAALVVADKSLLAQKATAEVLDVGFAADWKDGLEDLLSRHQLMPKDIDVVSVHGSPRQHVGAICDQLTSQYSQVININQVHGYWGETLGICEMTFNPAKKYGFIVNVSECEQISFLLYRAVE